ncbi:MAG: hypothetical protein KDD53_12500, partial [Bdellovibrionales bacterium]|nr:hypothetical protein [Bdellovibrionales bacterium]
DALPISVANYASVLDPTNTSVIYAAALIAELAGDRDRALDLFHKVVLNASELRANQKTYIIRGIQSDVELERVLPARFPQAIEWAEILVRYYPDAFLRLKSSLSNILFKAIRESRTRVDTNAIPLDVHQRWVERVSRLPLSHAFLQSLDAELESVHRKRFELGISSSNRPAEFYSLRKELQRLSTIPGLLRADSKPTISSLEFWGDNQLIYLDSYHASVGFFLPKGQLVGRIEIVPSSERNLSVSLEELQVYVSEDNQNWTLQKLAMPIEQYIIEHKIVSVISVNPSNHRYWKIHFNGSARKNSLQNQLSQMLRVFGHHRPEE